MFDPACGTIFLAVGPCCHCGTSDCSEVSDFLRYRYTCSPKHSAYVKMSTPAKRRLMRDFKVSGNEHDPAKDQEAHVH